MGAVLVHGKTLVVERGQTDEGGVFVEVDHLDGDCEFPRERGVDEDLWPIFYENLGSVTSDEVSRRCEALRQALANLSPEEIRAKSLLTKVSQWLGAGENFCITE